MNAKLIYCTFRCEVKFDVVRIEPLIDFFEGQKLQKANTAPVKLEFSKSTVKNLPSRQSILFILSRKSLSTISLSDDFGSRDLSSSVLFDANGEISIKSSKSSK